jgi:hypothetical protein
MPASQRGLPQPWEQEERSTSRPGETAQTPRPRRRLPQPWLEEPPEPPGPPASPGPTPAEQARWALDVLGTFAVPTLAGAVASGLGAGLPAVLRWLVPFAVRLGTAGGWEAAMGRDPLRGVGIQALTESLTPAVAVQQRLLGRGVRALAPEAERHVAERAARLAAIQRMSPHLTRALEDEARSVVPWWSRLSLREILLEPTGREVLSEHFGTALRQAARELDGTLVPIQPELGARLTRTAVVRFADGSLTEVPWAALRTLPPGAREVLMDAGEAVRRVHTLPESLRYRALRELDVALEGVGGPATAEWQEARRIFREGTRFLDYFSQPHVPMSARAEFVGQVDPELLARRLEQRPPTAIVGAPEAARAAARVRRELEAAYREYLQSLPEAERRLMAGRTWQQAEAFERQQLARAQEALDLIRRGKLPPREGRGAYLWVHVPGTPMGLHVGRFYTSGVPRTRAEYLWAQAPPTVLGPAVREVIPGGPLWQTITGE